MNEIEMWSGTENQVKILQEKLKMLGFYNPVITGSFDASTRLGVEEFQKSVGLASTGIVDEETWEKINSSKVMPISLYPTLKFGFTGSAVSDLQTKLKSILYYTGLVNGNFDLETQNAVLRFQINNDLTADGIVGSRTWNVLNQLYGNLSDCVLTNQEENIYIVQKGDTLYGIAKRFQVTVEEIKKSNQLTSDVLQIGQKLIIPSEVTSDFISYVVQKGDTLYTLSKRYRVTVDAIKQMNSLTSDVLQIGQVLKIPTSSSENYITYTVQKRDTLYMLSKRYRVTVDAIKKLNFLTSDVLQIGQVLKIPTSSS